MTISHPPPARQVSLEAIRSFEAAARHGSFASAAVELNVTPAAVSHQVRRLEQRLGVLLFERTHRKVALTAAGQAFAAQLRSPLDSIHAAIDNLLGHERRRLYVSTIGSFAAKWLAPRLHEFAQAYPDWQVRVEVENALVQPGQGQVDLCIRYGAGPYPNCWHAPLLDADMTMVAHPDYWRAHNGPGPVDWSGMVLLADGSAEHDSRIPGWQAWFARLGAGAGAKTGAHFDSTHLAIEAAAAGHGLALVPLPLVEADLAQGRLVRPFPLALENPYRYWLVCDEAMCDTPGVRHLREWLLGKARGGDGTAAPSTTPGP